MMIHEHDPPVSSAVATPSERAAAARAPGRSWLRWAPKGFAIGMALALLAGAATHPFLESRARQALAFGILVSACTLDWSRRKEFPWWAYAAAVAVFVGLAFAVWYLMPR
ncbi:MAG TPA: hypothetical protein VFJ82_14365 [Longimicrobium sp.]|nr:hypothetical protein [Longimicrobium sp.]